MAIVDARILRSIELTESKGDKGTIQLTGSQDILVICDAKDPDFGDILADRTLYLNLGVQRIPQLNDSITLNGVPMFVTSRSISYYKDNERAVLISVKYDAKQNEEAEPPKPEDVDPETWQRITVTSQQITKPARGWSSFAKLPDENAQNDEGTGAQNSAGDPVDGLEEESSHVKLTYANSQVKFPNFRELQRYTNRCNNAAFLGAEKYTVRMVGWNAEYDQKNNVWSISVEFLYNPDGWQIKFIDAGFNENINGERRAIVDKAGNPVSKPVPLDGDGKALALPVGSGQVVEPEEREIYPYKICNMSALFVNCGI